MNKALKKNGKRPENSIYCCSGLLIFWLWGKSDPHKEPLFT